MTTNVPAITATANAGCSALPRTGAAPDADQQHAGAPPDRVTNTTNRFPALLTLGAVTAAQLVPGVVEAEGLAGTATAAAIGIRAVIANPAVAALAGAGTAALGHYAVSLAHDATAGTAPFKAFAEVGKTLDTAIRASLGIPPSGTP